VLGEDVPREPWPREQLLALAPERTADGFLVPPIGA
jgi:Asp-tRNA(Asn)/Glu-tRNA(Gln) amidotransferase C subunit